MIAIEVPQFIGTCTISNSTQSVHKSSVLYLKNDSTGFTKTTKWYYDKMLIIKYI